jgi:hypothetical protein
MITVYELSTRSDLNLLEGNYPRNCRGSLIEDQGRQLPIVFPRQLDAGPPNISLVDWPPSTLQKMRAKSHHIELQQGLNGHVNFFSEAWREVRAGI